MSKFKMKLKLTGLEIEIEGSRDDVPNIARNLGQQMSGLLQPVSMVTPEEYTAVEVISSAPARSASAPKKPTTRRPRSSTASGENRGRPPADAVDFRHNAGRLGTPEQTWPRWQKGLWLLYVAKEQAGNAEMTTPEIVNTFNKHFRTFGAIRGNEVSRDLAKRIGAPDMFVGQDTTKNPPTWYLTESGERHVQRLIADSLSTKAAAKE